MKVKSKTEIDAAIDKHRSDLDPQRANELVGHVRAAEASGKMDELDAIFSEHLTAKEKAFYLDIVEGSKSSPLAV